jgi:3-hydroxyacyl-CoA dehydrogenase/enoyl-CoA hydratase/3-hydroxybutyryl-CoA epimerase
MNTATYWKSERETDGVVWLALDKPATSTNVLSSEVLVELGALIGGLAANPPRAVIVTSAKSNGFIAGADIREFTAFKGTDDAYALIRAGQGVFDRLAALPCPTVAAIHGFALGGGLELALACRYRIAVDDESLALGFPEVQLGIHPGFGGTVRAVRLVGVRPAMQLMLSGKPVRAAQALRMGLIDCLVAAPDLRTAARAMALAAPHPRQAPFIERVLSTALARPFVKSALLREIAARAPRDHYPAPYAIVDLWARFGAHGPMAFDAEARSIAELFGTATARNLIRVFMLQDRLKAAVGKGAAPVKHVHVVGAGVMGADIAAWSALRGCTVTLQDRELQYIEPALERARALFEKRIRDPAKRAAASSRLTADVAGDGIGRADVVIEAIFENLEAKRALYAILEPRMQQSGWLATNTSSLTLEPLAERLSRPERLVGLHFFNPVAQMPLIEIVRGARTDATVVQAAQAFARRLDKLPLPCRSAPGFVVNRVLMPYLHEAMFAAEEGVPLAVIDAAAVDFGMPVGPMELIDVVGLDVASHVGEIIARELGRPAPEFVQLRERLAAKKLGKKTHEGFYVWKDGKPLKAAAAAIAAPVDLTDRMVLVLVNECVACLRERVVEDADLIDAAVIFGTGFAPFRGGPLAYARSVGVSTITQRLGALAERYGSRFRPDAGWALLT